MLVRFLAYVRALLTRRRIDGEADDELRFHIEQETAVHVARGASPAEARRLALRDLGGLTQVKEAVREVRGTRLGAISQDVRYAARSICRERGFSATIVVTVALGIAAATTIFSVVNGVLYRPLPYGDADRIFVVSEGVGSDPPSWESAVITSETFNAWRDLGTSVEELAAYSTPLRTLRLPDEAVRLKAATVSANIFTLLGGLPAVGRFLRAEEDRPAANPVVVISYGLWRDRFSLDAGIIGRSIVIDDEPHLVVGVAPESFYFPDRDVAMWLSHERRPGGVDAPVRWSDWAIVRLRSGVSREEAAAEASVIAQRAVRVSEDGEEGARSVALMSLLDRQTMTVRPALRMLMLTSLGLLLIVIANTTNLFLLRSLRQRREVAVRAALGASRIRIVQGLLVHGLMIGGLGGGLGVIITTVLLRLLVSIAPADFPRLADIVIERHVIAFAVAATVLSVLVSALVPALRTSGRGIRHALYSDAPGARRLRLLGPRSASTTLLVAGLTLACVLLITATLLGRSFVSLASVDPGYSPSNVLTAQVSFPAASTRPEQRSIAEQLLHALAGKKSVQSVGVTNALPLEKVKVIFDIRRAGQGGSPSERVRPDFRVVSPGYFETVGMRLLAGRAFTWEDREGNGMVAVVNKSFVHRYLGGASAVGAAFAAGSGQPWIIIGVVQDVHYSGLDQPASPTLYTTFLQRSQVAFFSRVDVVVRTDGPPAAFVGSFRATVRDVDDRLGIYGVATMTEQLGESMARPKLYSASAVAFALAAMAISAVGLYGTLAYSIGQRRRELAIRTALGATSVDVVRLVARETAIVVAVSIVAGCALGFGASGLLRGLLFRIAPTDPISFGLAPGSIVLVAVCAAVVPVRHALRVQPARVLRDN